MKINVSPSFQCNGFKRLFLLTFTAWAFLLTSKGNYWDGSLISSFVALKRKAPLEMWFYEAGLPIQVYYHWALSFLPFPLFFHQLVSLLSVFCIGYTVFLALRDYYKFPEEFCMLAGALTILFPVYSILYSSVLMFYIFSQALYFLSWLFIIRLNYKKFSSIGFSERTWLHYLACFPLFLSFFHNSLLVLHYGFFLCLFFLPEFHIGLNKKTFLKKIIKFIKINLIFVVLPLVFWFLKKQLFAPSGQYASYNVVFTPGSEVFWTRVVLLAWAYVPYLVVSFFNIDAIRELPGLYIISLPVLFMLSFVWTKNHKKIPAKKLFIALVVALLVTYSGIFPYTVVGKSARWFDWRSRDGFLLGASFGVFVSCIYFYFSGMKSRFFKILASIGISMVASGFITHSAYRLIHLEARKYHDMAIIHYSKSLNLYEGTTLFWQDDFSKHGAIFGQIRAYEYSALLEMETLNSQWFHQTADFDNKLVDNLSLRKTIQKSFDESVQMKRNLSFRLNLDSIYSIKVRFNGEKMYVLALKGIILKIAPYFYKTDFPEFKISLSKVKAE